MRATDFRCPPMPPELAQAARRSGRLDVETAGHLVTREWYWGEFARWKAAYWPELSE